MPSLPVLRRLAFVVLATVTFGGSWPAAAPKESGPPRYTVTELPIPPGTVGAYAFDINEHGDC